MFRWHHQLNEQEFEQTPRVSEGQGILEHCRPWGHKESDTTQQLNNNSVRASVSCQICSWYAQIGLEYSPTESKLI